MSVPLSDEFGWPPALVLDVSVHVQGTPRARTVRAKIDTGADLSVIPQDLVKSLRLSEFGARFVAFHRGDFFSTPTYLVDIRVAGTRFPVEVVGHQRPYVLLGRDVLNEGVLHLDGPYERFALMFP